MHQDKSVLVPDYLLENLLQKDFRTHFSTLLKDETVPDDICLAKLTLQCTLSVVTGAVGGGVAWHLLGLDRLGLDHHDGVP